MVISSSGNIGNEIEGTSASLDIVVDYYIPGFLWDFWSETCPSPDRNFNPGTEAQPIGLHVYDPLKYELTSGCNVKRSHNIFAQMESMAPLEFHEHAVWRKLNNAFTSLEQEAETAIRSVIHKVSAKSRSAVTTSIEGTKLTLGKHSLRALKKYLLFLRFRHVDAYQELLRLAHRGVFSSGTLKKMSLFGCSGAAGPSGMNQSNSSSGLAGWVQLSEFFIMFFEGGTNSDYDTKTFNFVCEMIHPRFNSILEIELCVGMAAEPDEFILTSSCFGVVDDVNAPSYDNPYFHYFYPITPNFVFYLFIDASMRSTTPIFSQTPRFLSHEAHTAESIDYGIEVSIDIYQRNTLLLQTVPQYVIFSSSRSMIRTLTYYIERNLPGNSDCKKLLWLCRKESVTYTLLVKASIEVIDLTDDVVRVGERPVGLGGFADVWKGVWTDRQDKGKKKLVALKVLRAHVVGYVQERLLKRLQQEIRAWHYLQHPYIAQFYGIIQIPGSVAMVSPWCENGSLVTYLKDKNPGADRLRLLYEVACGIHYLHSCSPSVIHGDLKGCNILVDSDEHAIITDFGLAKVLEEVAHDINDMPSSLHQGSVRWMAPELMFAMVEDSGANMGGSGHSAEGGTSHSQQRCLPVTRYSDVYAFASVCLEVLTGALPYPNRPDYGIPIDLMRGIKPTRGSVWFANVEETSDLWTLMNQCWEPRPLARPTMQEMLDCLNKWARTVESDDSM